MTREVMDPTFPDNLSHEFVAVRTRLGYCFSIGRAHGRTLEGSVAVWDTRHPRFSRRHLVTCLSRGREAAAAGRASMSMTTSSR